MNYFLNGAGFGQGTIMPFATGPVVQHAQQVRTRPAPAGSAPFFSWPSLNNRFDDLGPYAPGHKAATPGEMARMLNALFPDTAALQPSAIDPVTAAHARLQQACYLQLLRQAWLWQAHAQALPIQYLARH